MLTLEYRQINLSLLLDSTMQMECDITRLEEEIIDQYINDGQQPWIIAFSGGKDSTTLLQIVWNSISKIEPRLRNRKIHVVCNNTLVENPVILKYVRNQLDLIKHASSEQSMPIEVEHTIPSMNVVNQRKWDTSEPNTFGLVRRGEKAL